MSKIKKRQGSTLRNGNSCTFKIIANSECADTIDFHFKEINCLFKYFDVKIEISRNNSQQFCNIQHFLSSLATREKLGKSWCKI